MRVCSRGCGGRGVRRAVAGLPKKAGSICCIKLSGMMLRIGWQCERYTSTIVTSMRCKGVTTIRSHPSMYGARREQEVTSLT